MNRLVEIRRQEHFCRERALFDSERKLFWLAEAEIWEQRDRKSTRLNSSH